MVVARNPYDGAKTPSADDIGVNLFMKRKIPVKTDDPKMGEVLIKEVFNLWINPEIERRRKSGQIRRMLRLKAAQVVMTVDGAPEVRLNEEVKIVIRMRATKAVKAGEVFVIDDTMEIEDMELTDADPNAGHVTLFGHGGAWRIKFDFRYNSERCREILTIAREFLDTAASCQRKKNLSAFVDNLFSATELMAKAELLMIPDKAILYAKSHGVVSPKYNMWGKLGNTDQAYVQLLNRLSSLRKPARYGPKNRLNVKPDEAATMLKTAKQMMKRVSASVPQRVKIPPI